MEHHDLPPGVNRTLLALALIFKLIGGLSVSETLNLTLTVLSICSVFMVIVINLEKFYSKVKKLYKWLTSKKQ